MKNKKIAGTIVALIVTAVMMCALLLATGCSIADTQTFTVDLHTEMTVAGNFYGERVMTVTFDKSPVLSAFENLDELESFVEKRLPECLEGKLIDDENGTRYELVLRFTSQEDYLAKIESLLGRKPSIVFESSDKIFMKGLTFQEDFESKELFSFIDVNEVVAAFVSDADISESDMQVAAAFIKQTGVSINVDGKEYRSEGGKVDVADGKATMISKVSFKTVLKANGYFERTIEFRMLSDIDQESYVKICDYFESVKPSFAEIVAGEYPATPVITVEFKARDVSDLSAMTTQIMGDTCTASFGDVTDANVPFASVEELSETISFARLCEDSQMPFTYNIVSERGAPAQLSAELDGIAVDSQPTLGGNTLDYGSQAVYVTLNTRYQSISTANLVYYNLIAHGDDSYTREIYIIMDEDTSDEVLSNIRSYYDTKGAQNTKINILSEGFSDEFKTPCVEIIISGGSKEITRAEDMLFGGSTERKLTYGKSKSIINTAPDTELCDVYDISSLLSMTNVTSYYYSFMSDENLRNGTVETDTGSYSVKGNDSNCLGFMMSEGAATVKFIGSYTNIDAIIFIILLVLLILLALVLVTIIVLRYLKRKNGKENEDKKEEKEPFPVVIENDENPAEISEESETEEAAIVMPAPAPVRDLTEALEPEEEPKEQIEVESYPTTTPEIDFTDLYTETKKEEPEDNGVKVAVKPIVPIYAEQAEQKTEEKPIDEPVVYQPPEEVVERFDESNKAPEVPFEKSPFEKEYATEFESGKASVYSDEDMLNDLEALGKRDEYIERFNKKVKIKVKKHRKK